MYQDARKEKIKLRGKELEGEKKSLLNNDHLKAPKPLSENPSDEEIRNFEITKENVKQINERVNVINMHLFRLNAQISNKAIPQQLSIIESALENYRKQSGFDFLDIINNPKIRQKHRFKQMQIMDNNDNDFVERMQRQLEVNYDNVFDILYISFGNPIPSYSETLEDGIYLRYDMETDELTGMTILDYKERKKRGTKTNKMLSNAKVRC